MIIVKEGCEQEPVLNPIEQRGIDGEAGMLKWLTLHGLSYLYVRQGQDSFASLFTGAVKRPDFLVLFESVGLIAVDVKNYTLWHGQYTLALEEEVKRVLSFERIFRIPVWYAYVATDDGKQVWYWISALKAVEVGTRRKKRDSGQEFLAIKLKYFERIETNADLGKLYTHRLKGVSQLEVLNEPTS